ncbi:MAG: DMT family transporter [Planctomycetota bacterium]|nr:DMT family transporter [Planctomycetota bacterium]
MQVFLVFVALVMGVSSAVQGATNGTLANRIGLPAAVFASASVLTAVAAVAWLVTGRRGFATEPASPWFLYLGGIYGVIMVAGAAFAFPRLGAGPTTAVMVAAQLGAALVLDHCGLPAGKVEVTPMRIVGVGFLLVGALLVLWPKLFPRGAA